MTDLAVIIQTFNKERHIKRSIRSAQPIANQVILAESYSTDWTVEIARGLGAADLQYKFVNHAKQFQRTLDNYQIETEWVIRLLHLGWFLIKKGIGNLLDAKSLL